MTSQLKPIWAPVHRTCGPAQLDKMLTEARPQNAWLREGTSVPQQQVARDFGKSRAKALKDVKDQLPVRQRAGMSEWKKKRGALPRVADHGGPGSDGTTLVGGRVCAVENLAC